MCTSVLTSLQVYVTEISTSSMRGFFGSFNQLFISVGIIVVKALGFENFLDYVDISLIATGTITLFAILLLFVKETPPWLYKKGRDLEGNHTLHFLRGPRANVTEEICGIQSTLTDAGSFRDQVKALRKRSIYLPLILIQVLMVFQQFTIFYFIHIFDVTSLPLAYDLEFPLSTLVVGLLQVLATLASVILVDLLGRKTLLVVSGSGMVICSVCLGIWFLKSEFYYFDDDYYYYSIRLEHSLLIFELLFIMFSSLGWGPIPWLMMSELVPLQVRGLATAAATFMNWFLAFCLTVIFNNIDQAVITKFAWWTFSFVMLCSIIFVLFMVPETKRCTLEEIEEHFKKGRVCYNPCKSMVQHSHRRERCRGIELCI